MNMKNLWRKIETNDISAVRNWLLTNPKYYKSLNFYRVVRSVNNSKMLRTFFEICGKEFREFFRKRESSILICMIREFKKLNMIKETVKFDKDSVNHVDTLNMSPLLYAIINNSRIAVVKCLLENNADANIRCFNFKTALHFVDNFEVVKLLIEFGADINCRTIIDSTPLICAIEDKRDKSVILELLKNNADVEMSNYRGRTCLHLALYYRYDTEVINQICDKTLDYNIKDNDGLTPLCYAVNNHLHSSYETRFIHELIEKGFIVNFKVLIEAIKHCRDLNIISILSSYADIRCSDNNGDCILHHANDSRLIEMFVRRGASINHENDNGQTPLMYAITHRRSIKIMESLLHWGSDIKKLKTFNNIEFGDLIFFNDDVFNLLVLNGMSVDVKNKFIKYFISRQLNFIAGPKRKSNLFKIGLLKHIFLSNENIVVPENLMRESKVRKLILVFNNELEKMKNEKLINDITYRDFCLKQYRSLRTIDEKFLEANLTKIKNLFPIFFNEVVIKIKTNIKITKLKRLRRSVLSLTLTERINRNVVLNCDTMYTLSSFMPETDIKCLLAAAITDDVE